MVQESTMICVDNSEWMRNGDFTPTRLQSQQDAVNLVIQCKLRSNPENAVGLLSMANSVQVLSSMSTEINRLLMKTHQLEPSGNCNFLSAVKVAHLALKHRQNRNHKMRIVMFIGSPLQDIDASELMKTAKKLKKEKVHCDVIIFGENGEESSVKFSQFVDTLNGKDGNGSNLLFVPAGSSMTEALLSSAVCRSEDGANATMGGAYEFGMDAENDPDLALALRVSMEEERARQAAEAAANGGAAPAASPPAQDPVDMDMSAMTEEQQLEWALRLSMQENVPAVGAQAAVEERMEVDVTGNNTPDSDNIDELMNNPDLLQQIVNEIPSDQDKKKDEKDDGAK